MRDKIPHTTILIDRELLKKFRFVAAYNGRSANKEIEQFIRKSVEVFEKEHGPIEIKDIVDE